MNSKGWQTSTRAGAGDLPRQTKNGAQPTWYWSVIEVAAGECGGDVLGGVEGVVEVAGRQEQKIEWGREICPANRKLSATHSVLVC
jgi:hypothetical protein